MMNQKRDKLRYAAAGLAVLLLAAFVLTGAAAAEDVSYSITTTTDPSTASGWITTNPQNSANAGATVTITVNPPTGSHLSTLNVTSTSGTVSTQEVTPGQKYTFIMPGENVTINAKFWTALTGGAFYYETVQGFSGVYKYLDNIIDLTYSNPGVLEPSSSRPEGQYASTTTTDGFILKKLDADVYMYVYDGDKIISSAIGNTVPRGSKVSFRISPNIPTAYSTQNGWKLVGLKFISPSGTVASTYLGVTDLSAASDNWKENNGLESVAFKLGDTLEEGEWTVFAYFDSKNSQNQPGFFASYTPDSYLNGAPFHFTISSSTVSLTVEPTTVQSGKEFTITVSGKPNEMFYLKPNDKYMVKPGQEHFEYGENLITIGQNGSTRLALTAVSRGIFTLQLCSKDGKTVEDDCEIEIVRATLTAEADKDSYYMGTDVTLRGTNESTIYPLYYYIEGANISFQQIPDDSLKPTMTGKEWETTIKGSYFSGLKLDTAAYTIYVSSVGPDGQGKYDKQTVTGPNAVVSTATVRLIKPQITITSSTSIVIQDENLVVKGVAETASQVRYYIFGNNKHCSDTVDVGRNGNFVIDKTLLKNEFDTGQYFMVIQHPMYDGDFNVAAGKSGGEDVVALNTTGNALNPDGTVATDSQILFSLNERQSSNAAQALCNAIDSEDIDDIYTKCSFVLKADATTVDPIPSEVTRGMPFTVSGTAARVDGTSISVELLSTTFSPESKYSATSASFVTMITYPGADGKWAVTFDTSGLNIDTYNISVSANAVKVHQAVIRVAEGTAAPAAQEIPAAPTAAAATPTPTPAPTKNASTPGFGAAVILAGFGAAALALSGRRL